MAREAARRCEHARGGVGRAGRHGQRRGEEVLFVYYCLLLLLICLLFICSNNSCFFLAGRGPDGDPAAPDRLAVPAPRVHAFLKGLPTRRSAPAGAL